MRITGVFLLLNAFVSCTIVWKWITRKSNETNSLLLMESTKLHEIAFPADMRIYEFVSIPNVEMDENRCIQMTYDSHMTFAKSANDSTSSGPYLRDGEDNNVFLVTLFLADFNTIYSNTARSLLHTYCGGLAMGKLDGNVLLWGPHWPGWNEALSISQNVRLRWPETQFSLIVSYFDPKDIAVDALYLTFREECVGFDLIPTDESRWNCTLYNVSKPWDHYDIVLFNYESDFLAIYDHFADHLTHQMLGREDILLSLWSQTVLPGIFVHYDRLEQEYEKRPYDLCLIDYNDTVVSPSQKTLLTAIENHSFDKYGLKVQKFLKLNNNSQDDQQYQKYVEFLFQCKAVVTRNPVQNNNDVVQYVEVTFAGALLVGEIPIATTFEKWSEIIVDISEIISSKHKPTILENLKKWVSDDFKDLRQAKINKAKILMFFQRTAQHGWLRLQEVYQMFLENHRGFVFSP